jgi:hypothetical protein
MTDQTTNSAGGKAETQVSTEKIGSPTKIHRVSPWPPFVAVGFAVSEIGIVLNLVSLAIGGIVLFGGSVAGILTETKYVKNPWRPLVVLGVFFIVAGAYIYASQVPQFGLETLFSVGPANAIAMRGEAVLIAGGLLVFGSILGTLLKPLQTEA